MTDKINKGMTIGEVVQKHPEAAEVMLKNGLQCVGCHFAAMETIEQGATSHGIDADKLVDEMNKTVEKKNKK